jgi:hypothetical protein
MLLRMRLLRPGLAALIVLFRHGTDAAVFAQEGDCARAADDRPRHPAAAGDEDSSVHAEENHGAGTSDDRSELICDD